jgi:hypothetical protein
MTVDKLTQPNLPTIFQIFRLRLPIALPDFLLGITPSPLCLLAWAYHHSLQLSYVLCFPCIIALMRTSAEFITTTAFAAVMVLIGLGGIWIVRWQTYFLLHHQGKSLDA